jgi:hypothetical protein
VRYKGWASSVSIATAQMVKEQGFEFLVRARHFSLLCSIQPIQWESRALLLMVKQWGMKLITHLIFTAWCLIKHRDNFTFT